MARELTTKQRRFVEAYDGNGVEAARSAGYAGSYSVLNQVACENLQKPAIVKAIQRRQEVEDCRLIADRQQRQRFWSKVMQNDGEDMRARLRASELLGRSEADFIERREHTGKDARQWSSKAPLPSWSRIMAIRVADHDQRQHVRYEMREADG